MAAGQRDALKITAPLQNGKTIICVEFVNKEVSMKFDVSTGLESATLICEGFMYNRTGCNGRCSYSRQQKVMI